MCGLQAVQEESLCCKGAWVRAAGRQATSRKVCPVLTAARSQDLWRRGPLMMSHVRSLSVSLVLAATAIAGIEYDGRRPSWGAVEAAVRRLLGHGAPLVVITLGSDGAVAANQQQWWFQPTVDTVQYDRPPVDTTGCGDVSIAPPPSALP